MNLLAGESVDGESASQFVAAENDIEDIFFEAEENDGRNWKARGILPVLVLFNALNWASNFPSIPTVIRGPLADTLCDLSPQVKAFWNRGHVLFESFRNRFDAVVHATSSGLDNKGFEGSRTVSFELSDDCVRVDVPSYISVDSKALLAIKGPWFTSGHIESAGAESIAKLESGRKLWLIASNIESSRFLYGIQTFKDFHRLLMDRAKYGNDEKLCRGLSYHLAKPGDLLIQPPCFAHCVLTGRTSAADGSTSWSLVHGWEGLNVSDHLRGSLVIDRFCSGVKRGFILQWLEQMSLGRLIKLLRIKYWRKALSDWKKYVQGRSPETSAVCSESKTVRAFLVRKEMVEHLEAFHRYEYNLKESLSSIKRVKRKSLKNRRLANFGRSVSESGHQDCPRLTDLDSDDEELPVAAWVEIWNATSE